MHLRTLRPPGHPDPDANGGAAGAGGVACHHLASAAPARGSKVVACVLDLAH
jgi:hypothetical protein